MAVTTVKVTAKAVDPLSGRAALTVSDPNGNIPGVGAHTWSVDDGGKVVALSVESNSVEAGPIAVGVANATMLLVEAGVLQTATARITVTNVGGRLVAAWSSATLTVN